MKSDTCDRNGRCGERALISVIVPCYDEQEVLPLLVEQLRQMARTLDVEMDCDTEIVLVDDGSRDETWNHICSYADDDARIRGARLSRNFGQQAAMTCGYALAEGDVVVCLDADLQDPPEVVPEMVARWQEGADVVYGVRRKREGETKFKLGTARFFYWLIRKLGAVRVRAECGDFRLMSRRAVDELLRLGETNRFVRGMVGWLGFPAAEVLYERQGRAAGKTKWPLRKMIRLATDAIVSFSHAPLRLAYHLATTLSLVFLAYLAWKMAAHVWFDEPLTSEGPMVLLAVVVFGAANLLGQAILGEYIGRIHQQSLGRPLYIVQEQTARTRRGRLAERRLITRRRDMRRLASAASAEGT